MATIFRTKCDCCGKEVNTEEYGAPTYHRLQVGGSDFEMSFGSPEERLLDFCSFECLKSWVDKILVDEAMSS